MKPATRIAALALPIVLSSSCFADWTLDNSASSLHYVTSKAAAVSEINTFTSLTGTISETGSATLTIDLSSVDTGIAIRNQRMQEIVFATSDYPSATITVDVSPLGLDSMVMGSSSASMLDAVINMHGAELEVSALLSANKLPDNSIQVHNVKPILVSAGQFGLADAVEQLRELAGLSSINPNVVVNFSLLYRPD